MTLEEANPWRGRWRLMLLTLGPPLVTFIVARAFLAVAATSTGLPAFSAGIWARWDSGQYLAIAKGGYELGRCGALHVYNYPADAWCGNTGWLPGYPLALRALGALGMDWLIAGVLLAGLFQLGSLIVLWALLLKREFNPGSLLCLAFFAFTPGMVYEHAVFPISMFLFAVLLMLVFLEREQWLLAGLFGALAAFTYTSGFVLAAPAGIAALLAPGKTLTFRFLRACAVGMLVLLGFGAVLLWHQVSVGAWDALFRSHAKYASQGFNNPIPAFLYVVKPLFEGTWRGRDEIRSGQTVLVAALLIPASVAAFFWGAGSLRERATLLTLVLVVWSCPYIVGGIVSSYRSEALLAPAGLLLRRLPLPIQTSVITAFVLIAYPIAILFYQAFLV